MKKPSIEVRQGSDRYGNLSQEQLFEIYKSVLSEEQFFLEAHQKRSAFFLIFNSSIVAATVAGATRMESALEYSLLLIGPLLIIYMSFLGKEGTFRFYQRFIETITIRAKLEQILRFDVILPEKDHATYWTEESLIPARHFKGRSRFESSEEFKSAVERKGYQAVVNSAFNFFIVVSIVFFLVIAALAMNARNVEDSNRSTQAVQSTVNKP